MKIERRGPGKGATNVKMTYYCTTYSSPLGPVTLASDGEALVGLWLQGQKSVSDAASTELEQRDGLPVFQEGKDWLEAYFAGERPDASQLALAPAGSPFCQAVWRMLREIPYGATTTYGEIARKMAALTGKPGMAAQAVGGAVGHNPISLIIPCHRVIGAGGSLTGYAGGLAQKVWLLRHEGVDLGGMTWPGVGPVK